MIRCPHWQAFAPPVHLATADERKNRPAFPGKRSDAVPAKGDKVARDKTPAGRVVPAKKRITSSSAANGVNRAVSTVGKISSGQVEVAALHNAARIAGQRGAGASTPAANKAACPTHKVRAGETLFSIAAARLGNGRYWTRIRDANGNLDPTRLKPGVRLRLPCTAQAGTRPASATASGSSGVGARSAKASVTPDRKKPATISASKPTAPSPPLPTGTPTAVWTAKKGETFRAVIERWAMRAGHTVIIDTSDAWTIAVPVRLEGDFRTAIGKLVRGLSHDGVAPPVRIHPNNVVRVGL